MIHSIIITNLIRRPKMMSSIVIGAHHTNHYRNSDQTSIVSQTQEIGMNFCLHLRVSETSVNVDRFEGWRGV